MLEIRKLDSQAALAPVTSHSEFMPVSFEYLVSAIDFIDKELPEPLFIKWIENVISEVLAIIKEEQYLGTLLYLESKAQIQVPFKRFIVHWNTSTIHKLTLYSKRDIVEVLWAVSRNDRQEPLFNVMIVYQ